MHHTNTVRRSVGFSVYSWSEDGAAKLPDYLDLDFDKNAGGATTAGKGSPLFPRELIGRRGCDGSRTNSQTAPRSGCRKTTREQPQRALFQSLRDSRSGFLLRALIVSASPPQAVIGTPAALHLLLRIRSVLHQAANPVKPAVIYTRFPPAIRIRRPRLSTCAGGQSSEGSRSSKSTATAPGSVDPRS